MSTPAAPDPAKLVVGIFTARKNRISEAARQLAQRFGPADMVSPWLAFDYTDYYAGEMGGPLFRRVVSFQQLVDPGDLPRIKRFTNEVESRLMEGGRRTVNIDPGYLTRERLVLATGKNFTHRIYVGDGIYADLTLIYERGGFRTLPWTYPDYGAERMRTLLETVRNRYLIDLKRTDPTP